MGIGDGLIPDNLNMGIYEDICVVTDEEALEVSKRLAREEGLLCGISSGSNVAAALKLAKKLGPGSCYDIAGYGRALFQHGSFFIKQ
jgi:cysteine synthase A